MSSRATRLPLPSAMALVASVVEMETMRMADGSSMWMPSMTFSMPMEKSRLVVRLLWAASTRRESYSSSTPSV